MNTAPEATADTPKPHATLTLRIAFAGHRLLDRPVRVDDSRHDPKNHLPRVIKSPSNTGLAAALDKAFTAIAQAFSGVTARNVREGSHETIAAAHECFAKLPGVGHGERLTLLTGTAAGADKFAIDAWRGGDKAKPSRPVHAVLPFIIDDGAAGLDQSPEDTEVVPAPVDIATGKKEGFDPFEHVTALDGACDMRELPRRDPYLEQSRFLVRWAEVAVAVWDGAMPAGPGGTGDTVRLAIAKGIPVVWIDLGQGLENPVVRLISPGNTWTDGSFHEFCRALARGNCDEIAPPLDTSKLEQALADQYAPPAADNSDAHGHADGESEDEETAGRLQYVEPHRGRGETKAKLIDGIFYVGEKSWPRALSLLSACWQKGWHAIEVKNKVLQSAETPAQSGYILLVDESTKADNIATRTGNTHRFVQFLLLLFAFFAVLFGTLAAEFPLKKISFVIAELILVFLALVIWRARVMQKNHRLWSDTRRYAERLRALKATWPLAFDIADNTAEKPRTWTEWRARAIRRIAGPPTFAMREQRMIVDADHARDDPGGIVDSQRAYHHRSAARMGKAHSNLHVWEYRAFWLLFLGLVAFLLVEFIAEMFHNEQAHGLVSGSKNWLLILSATIPALGAAVIALEAKIGFEENAVRHRRLQPEFERLFLAMGGDAARSAHASATASHAPSIDEKTELLREAAQLHVSDADSWRDGMTRRQMVKL